MVVSWLDRLPFPAFATAGALVVGGAFVARLILGRPRLLEDVPHKMKALFLTDSNVDMSKAGLEVRLIDTPKPRSGQVLVRMVAAPINPSDDGDWKVARDRPLAIAKRCGHEGSGVVIGNGGGFFGWWFLGKKVSVVGDGVYADYVVVSAMTNVNSLPQEHPVEDGCAFFVNPFTVVGIVETVVEHGCKAFIHTAAASQLGLMMVKYCKVRGITVVNVVRRPEQAELLRKLGADYIIDTSQETWKKELSDLVQKLSLRLAFDAVAGTMTGELTTILSSNATVYVYGRLADSAVGGIDPIDLIYRKKAVRGWMVSWWITSGGFIRSALKSIKVAHEVRAHLRTIFASTFQDTRMDTALADYVKVQASTGRTGTKMRIRLGRM